MGGVCVLGGLVGEGCGVVLEGSHGTIFGMGNKNKIKISLILYACIINLILPEMHSLQSSI